MRAGLRCAGKRQGAGPHDAKFAGEGRHGGRLSMVDKLAVYRGEVGI